MKKEAVACTVIAVLMNASCTKVVRYETSREVTPDGTGRNETMHMINGEILNTIREEWQNEYLIATGSAPLIVRYNDYNRDRELARRGAELDAMANLAAQIGQISITETMRMSDLATSTEITSILQARLSNVEVVSRTFNAESEMWDVVIRMPKIAIYSIIEERVYR